MGEHKSDKCNQKNNQAYNPFEYSGYQKLRLPNREVHSGISFPTSEDAARDAWNGVPYNALNYGRILDMLASIALEKNCVKPGHNHQTDDGGKCKCLCGKPDATIFRRRCRRSLSSNRICHQMLVQTLIELIVLSIGAFSLPSVLVRCVR